MRDIKLYDTVILKDGRLAAVVEILGNHESFIIDTGSSPEDWETDLITADQVLRIATNKEIEKNHLKSMKLLKEQGYA